MYYPTFKMGNVKCRTLYNRMLLLLLVYAVTFCMKDGLLLCLRPFRLY